MNVFGVLADPTRARIVDSLADGARSAGELVALFSLTQPAVSRHLRVLREAGLVSVRPDGQRRLYRLETDPLREIDRWLDRYRRLWRDRLEALEHHMDEMEERE